MANKFLADISRDFLMQKNLIRYKMRKIAEMSDNEVISCCHHYCEDNGLVDEWQSFRLSKEKALSYCPYLKAFIESGLCYDMQMVSFGYVKSTVLHSVEIDNVELGKCCGECEYKL